MPSRLQHICCSQALSALCLIIGITIIIVNGVVISNFQKYLKNHSLRWPAVNGTGTYQALRLIPASLNKSPTAFIFACAALAIIVAISGLGRVVAASSVYECENKVKRRWNVLARAGSAISVVTIVTGLVFVFAEEYTSSKFHYTDAASSGQQFTRESWVCQMRQQYTSPVYGYFHWTCNDAQAARWLLVPLLVVSCLLAAIAFVDIPEKSAASTQDDIDTKSADSVDSCA